MSECVLGISLVGQFAAGSQQDDTVEQVKDAGGGLVNGADDSLAAHCKTAQSLHYCACTVAVQPCRRLVAEQQSRVCQQLKYYK